MTNTTKDNKLFLEPSFNTYTISSVFDTISQGMVLINNLGNIVYSNTQIHKLLGYSTQELIGLNHEEAYALLFGRYYGEEGRSWVNIKNGETFTERRRFVHKQGQAAPLEVHARPLYDEQNQFNGGVVLLKNLHEELLITVTKLVNSSLSLSEVIKNTTKAVVEHLGLASNAIFLLNNEKTKLSLVSCNIFDSMEQMPQLVLNVGEGAPGKIVQEMRPIYIKNLSLDPKIDEESRKRHGNKSSIGYPLVCNNEVLGVIAFDADIVREFTENEKSLFQDVANQVALAIYNAQLFTRLEHLSVTDGLTGVYNHRYLQERLKDEIERSKRNAMEISLLLIDVDNFKKYNDKFGHVSGDEILKLLAHLIKLNVRNIDVVARYGGEEFAVLLLDCDQEMALAIAERIRECIADYEFYGQENQSLGRASVSIGIAVNSKAADNKKLLSQADSALYMAKQTGRNNTQVYCL